MCVDVSGVTKEMGKPVQVCFNVVVKYSQYDIFMRDLTSYASHTASEGHMFVFATVKE